MCIYVHEMWIDKSEPENHLCDIWHFVTKYIDVKSFIYRYSFHLKMAAKFCIFMPRSGDMILNISTLYRWCTVVSSTSKYDKPKVENVTRRHSPSATFSNEGHHILIVVWPTMSCFADWSKRRQVTLSIIICPLHGHPVWHHNVTRCDVTWCSLNANVRYILRCFCLRLVCFFCFLTSYCKFLLNTV